LSYFFFSLMFVLLVLCSWFYALNYECQVGCFTCLSYYLFRFGFVLFICSEVLFFFGFFWCFFSNCWVFNFYFCSWPPYGFKHLLVDMFGYPLLNTVLLLSSGVSLTLVHYFILIRDYSEVVSSEMLSLYGYKWLSELDLSYISYGYCLTILLGFLFICFQCYEYILSSLSVNSTVYGSIFFVLTGFHGLHVFLGLVLLVVSYSRYLNTCYSSSDHVGFECSVWYWHFVDVVWLFLYLFVYWYGS